MRKPFVLALVLAATAATASAGYRYAGNPVEVNLTSRFATGAASTAFNSANTKEYVSCHTSAYATWGALICTATNPAGVVASCSTTTPTPLMVAAVGSISSETYVGFSWDTAGQCTGIWVANASYQAPKAHP